MIVTTGKHITIEAGTTSHIVISRTCEKPGVMTVSDRKGGSIEIYVEDYQAVCLGILRAAREKIEYVSSGLERGDAAGLDGAE
jgi:hypothetical protein